jgi:hypothetical protein
VPYWKEVGDEVRRLAHAQPTSVALTLTVVGQYWQGGKPQMGRHFPVRTDVDPWVAIVTQGSIDSLEGVRTLTSDTSLTLMRASGLAFFRSEISCLRSSME